MSMRVTKRCSKCSTTFKGATCTNDCPTKHLRWTVFEDRNVNGKRSRRTVGTFASSKDAEAARVEAEENTRHGRVSVSSTMTLEEWCDEWLETQGHRFAPTSMTTMMVGFRRWLIPALGGITLRDLSPIDFDRLYAEMLKSIKPVTVRNYSRNWHSLLNDAVRKGRLVRNPMDGSDLPKAEKVEPALLSPDDVGRVLELLKGERHGLLFRLLIVTGARRSEILAMTWDDLDLESEAPSFKIRRAITTSSFGLRVGPPKTESSKRTLALDAGTAEMLRELRQQHRIEAMRLGREAWLGAGMVLDRHDEPHNLDLVIRKYDGTPVGTSTVTHHWQRFLVRNGFDHVKLHSLRHAWATAAILNGVPMKTVQSQLGHSVIGTTMDIYSHVTEEAQAEATDVVMTAFGQ